MGGGIPQPAGPRRDLSGPPAVAPPGLRVGDGPPHSPGPRQDGSRAGSCRASAFLGLLGPHAGPRKAEWGRGKLGGSPEGRLRKGPGWAWWEAPCCRWQATSSLVSGPAPLAAPLAEARTEAPHLCQLESSTCGHTLSLQMSLLLFMMTPGYKLALQLQTQMSREEGPGHPDPTSSSGASKLVLDPWRDQEWRPQSLLQGLEGLAWDTGWGGM